MPVLSDVTNAFEELRLHHERALDELGMDYDSNPEEPDFFNDMQWQHQDFLMGGNGGGNGAEGSIVSTADSLPLGASALSTPPSSVVTQSQGHGQGGTGTGAGAGTETGAGGGKQRTMAAALGLRPQFNLDSANGLLVTVCHLFLLVDCSLLNLLFHFPLSCPH